MIEDGMGKRVFISYSHRQAQWVRDRLLPVLRAGGAEPLVDNERMVGREPVVGQMDALQDQSEFTVAVITADYQASSYCMHEYGRADKPFEILLDGSPLDTSRLYAHLPSDRHAEP
jgi:hypothetical protein